MKKKRKKYKSKNYITYRIYFKKIGKDGICFYRTLSYYFRDTEEDHKEFRDLVATYILNNPDEYFFR